METTIDSAPTSPPPEVTEYYLRGGGTKISWPYLLLFGLGLLFLIPMAGEGKFSVISILFMFPVAKEFYNNRRGRGKPFLVLAADHFLVGRPEIAIPYAAVERFVFAPSGTARPNVAFTLFLRQGEMIAEIKGGWPLEVKDGDRIVCRSVRLGRGVTSREFYDDFRTRLLAAGSVDALADPGTVAEITPDTGAALVMPKATLTPLVVRIGAFFLLAPHNLKWVSYRLGSLITLFVFFVLRLTIQDIHDADFRPYGLDYNVAVCGFVIHGDDSDILPAGNNHQLRG